MTLHATALQHYRPFQETTWSFEAQTPLRKRALDLAQRVAASTCSVLILGPTGVGKEVLARDIHRHSPRHQRPFISVNCAAIAPQLFESAFFGHLRGSFTGATADKPGFVELAHRGTLFLDEVGDLQPDAQAKLLRFLADGTYWPVGATVERRADVRILSATHRSIDVMQELFREDLYFRLSVVAIRIPALDAADIKAIAQSLVMEAMHQHGRTFTAADLDDLTAWCTGRKWKGGARELRNAIERFVVLRDATARMDEQFEAVVDHDGRGVDSGIRTKAGNASVAKEVDNLVFLGIARECADVRQLAERTDRTLQSAYGRLKKLGLRPQDLGPTIALDTLLDDIRRRLAPDLPWLHALLKDR